MPYSFSARVIHGTGQGRKIGFPTANLDNLDLNLDHGVYLAETKIKNKTYQGLLVFGLRKTLDNPLSVEIFLKDFNADIYGEEIEVKVIKKIREIIKFKNIEELIAQIKKDVALFCPGSPLSRG